MDVTDEVFELVPCQPCVSTQSQTLDDNVSNILIDQHPERKMVRLGIDASVQSCIKRFMYGTTPKKLWYEDFQQHVYDKIHYVRKYDGWYVLVYVDSNNVVRWQTMGGYIFTFVEALIQPAIKYIQQLVDKKIIFSDFAFKMEFTARDMHSSRERLHDIGNYLPTEVTYCLAVTDFFMGYTEAMDNDVATAIRKRRDANTKHKSETLKMDAWKVLFVSHHVDIQSRLNEANRIFGNRKDRYYKKFNNGEIDLEVAEAKLYVVDEVPDDFRVNPNPVPYLAKQISETNYEGYVLHCVADKKYMIWKFKLEQLGGLGYYYTSIVGHNDKDIDPNIKFAGKQFKARVLTMECLPNSLIPYQIGIGYFDPMCKPFRVQRGTNSASEAQGAYIVTDCLKLKGIFPSFRSIPIRRTPDKKYLMVTDSAADFAIEIKHKQLTTSNKSVANIIALLAEHANFDMYDMSKLVFSKTYTKNASQAFLNVSELGIVIGGSANMVYMSSQNVLHMQAATVKCVGIQKQKNIKPVNSHLLAQWLGTTGTLSACMSDSSEWTKTDWSNNLDVTKFAQSVIFSTDTTPKLLDSVLHEIDAFVMPSVSASLNIPKIYSYLNFYMYRPYIKKGDVYTLAVSFNKLKILIEKFRINIVNLNTLDPENWYYDDCDLKKSMIGKKTLISDYTQRSLEVPQTIEIQERIDVVIINDNDLDRYAQTTGSSPEDIYKQMVQRCSYRFIVVRDTWITQCMTARSPLNYYTPGTRTHVYTQSRAQDSESKPWRIEENSLIDEFLYDRQKERIEKEFGKPNYDKIIEKILFGKADEFEEPVNENDENDEGAIEITQDQSFVHEKPVRVNRFERRSNPTDAQGPALTHQEVQQIQKLKTSLEGYTFFIHVFRVTAGTEEEQQISQNEIDGFENLSRRIRIMGGTAQELTQQNFVPGNSRHFLVFQNSFDFEVSSFESFVHPNFFHLYHYLLQAKRNEEVQGQKIMLKDFVIKKYNGILCKQNNQPLTDDEINDNFNELFLTEENRKWRDYASRSKMQNRETRTTDNDVNELILRRPGIQNEDPRAPSPDLDEENEEGPPDLEEDEEDLPLKAPPQSRNQKKPQTSVLHHTVHIPHIGKIKGKNVQFKSKDFQIYDLGGVTFESTLHTMRVQKYYLIDFDPGDFWDEKKSVWEQDVDIPLDPSSPEQQAMVNAAKYLRSFNCQVAFIREDDTKNPPLQSHDVGYFIVFYEFPPKREYQALSASGFTMIHHLFFERFPLILQGAMASPTTIHPQDFASVFQFQFSSTYVYKTSNSRALTELPISGYYWQNQCDKGKLGITDADWILFFNKPKTTAETDRRKPPVKFTHDSAFFQNIFNDGQWVSTKRPKR